MKNEAPIAAASMQYSTIFRAGKRGKDGKRVEKKGKEGDVRVKREEKGRN